MYMIMELCKKETLHQKIRQYNQQNQLQSERETLLSWFQSIVLAVDYIHQRGYLHRDLKPSNVFFGQDGAVRLGDSGLVDEDAYLTLTSFVGTLAYISPEQLLGQRYTKSSDIFPLGIFCNMIFNENMNKTKGYNIII